MKLKLKRYLLLHKRLIRRKSYICMTLSIFLLILVLRGIATQDSSITSVAIAKEEGADEISRKVYESLSSPNVLIRYIRYDTEKEAIDAVAEGKADEAWIIPADLSELIAEFAEHKSVSKPIKIYARDPNVLHFFLREILEAQLYKHIGKLIYTDFAEKKLGKVSADYEAHIPDVNIFRIYDIGAEEPEEQPDYVTAPLRGFMALWLIISAIASAMYYISDEKKGLFIYWKTKSPAVREFLYIFVVMFDSAVIALLGLFLGGVMTDIRCEVPLILLYAVTLTLLAMIFRRIMRNEKILGVFTPVIITMAATFSPVFMDLRAFWYIQKIIPSYHYLESVFDPYYRTGMIVYCISLLGIVILIEGFKKILGFKH